MLRSPVKDDPFLACALASRAEFSATNEPTMDGTASAIRMLSVLALSAPAVDPL